MIPPPRSRTIPAPIAPALPVGDFAPRAEKWGTVFFLAGMWFTVGTMNSELASHVAHYAAIGIGLSLAGSIYIDSRKGLLNLIRADLLAILALYFLTMFEFLFKQDRFDALSGIAGTKLAIMTVVIGFSGMAIGRHLPNFKAHPLENLFVTPTPRPLLMTLLVSCLFLGTLNMLLVVNFNVGEMFHYFMAPRFTQPWSRDRLGDWKALLHELELILELIPPIAGVIFGRRKKFTGFQLFLTACIFGFVLFYGFSGGTRNVFATYLVTFLIAYAFALPAGKNRDLTVVTGCCMVFLVCSSFLMLQFREQGLENYIRGGYQYDIEHADEESLFIDYNLYSIERIVEFFPGHHSYLKWEVPYLAIIRPIPRAIWAGKPEGMSISIEDVFGVQDMTVAASFVGEAYMSYGWTGVFLTGLFFGVITGWWAHLASARNSELGILIYASGFLAAVISMRSLFVFTTAILPTLLALVGAWVIVTLIQKFQAKPRPVPRRPRPMAPGRNARP